MLIQTVTDLFPTSVHGQWKHIMVTIAGKNHNGADGCQYYRLQPSKRAFSFRYWKMADAGWPTPLAIVLDFLDYPTELTNRNKVSIRPTINLIAHRYPIRLLTPVSLLKLPVFNISIITFPVIVIVLGHHGPKNSQPERLIQSRTVTKTRQSPPMKRTYLVYFTSIFWWFFHR